MVALLTTLPSIVRVPRAAQIGDPVVGERAERARRAAQCDRAVSGIVELVVVDQIRRSDCAAGQIEYAGAARQFGDRDVTSHHVRAARLVECACISLADTLHTRDGQVSALQVISAGAACLIGDVEIAPDRDIAARLDEGSGTAIEPADKQGICDRYRPIVHGKRAGGLIADAHGVRDGHQAAVHCVCPVGGVEKSELQVMADRVRAARLREAADAPARHDRVLRDGQRAVVQRVCAISGRLVPEDEIVGHIVRAAILRIASRARDIADDLDGPVRIDRAACLNDGAGTIGANSDVACYRQRRARSGDGIVTDGAGVGADGEVASDRRRSAGLRERAVAAGLFADRQVSGHGMRSAGLVKRAHAQLADTLLTADCQASALEIVAPGAAGLVGDIQVSANRDGAAGLSRDAGGRAEPAHQHGIRDRHRSVVDGERADTLIADDDGVRDGQKTAVQRIAAVTAHLVAKRKIARDAVGAAVLRVAAVAGHTHEGAGLGIDGATRLADAAGAGVAHVEASVDCKRRAGIVDRVAAHGAGVTADIEAAPDRQARSAALVNRAIASSIEADVGERADRQASA